MAGDAIGVFDIDAEIIEVTAHDPQDQWQADQLIHPNQTDVGVGQTDLLEVQGQRQQDNQRV